MPIPGEATDAEWARVLYVRRNPAGPYAERWVHVHGCRQWFHVVRDTLTHEITQVRRLDDPPVVPERPHGPADTRGTP